MYGEEVLFVCQPRRGAGEPHPVGEDVDDCRLPRLSYRQGRHQRPHPRSSVLHPFHVTSRYVHCGAAHSVPLPHHVQFTPGRVRNLTDDGALGADDRPDRALVHLDLGVEGGRTCGRGSMRTQRLLSVRLLGRVHTHRSHEAARLLVQLALLHVELLDQLHRPRPLCERLAVAEEDHHPRSFIHLHGPEARLGLDVLGVLPALPDDNRPVARRHRDFDAREFEDVARGRARFRARPHHHHVGVSYGDAPHPFQLTRPLDVHALGTHNEPDGVRVDVPALRNALRNTLLQLFAVRLDH
mmetsp:Transcript_43647/g.99412  ORF Transcript_43647/g.99412 Transcript_43647/m.99412 type:complete len:297 (-) Transcript_43647:124-1014(-)